MKQRQSNTTQVLLSHTGLENQQANSKDNQAVQSAAK